MKEMITFVSHIYLHLYVIYSRVNYLPVIGSLFYLQRYIIYLKSCI